MHGQESMQTIPAEGPDKSLQESSVVLLQQTFFLSLQLRCVRHMKVNALEASVLLYGLSKECFAIMNISALLSIYQLKAPA